MSNYKTQEIAFKSLGYKETYIGFFEKEDQEVWFDVNSGNIEALMPIPECQISNAGHEGIGWLPEYDRDFSPLKPITYTVEQVVDFIKLHQDKTLESEMPATMQSIKENPIITEQTA